MNSTINAPVGRHHLARLQAVLLAAIGLLALWLAIASPAEPNEAVSWRDYRNYAVYFQSHQRFRCGPEELSEGQLNSLLRWCRYLELTGRRQVSGVQSLTDEECQFMLEVLEELRPDTQQLAGRWASRVCP